MHCHYFAKGTKRPLVAEEKSTFQPIDDQRDRDCLNAFADSLRKSLPNACLFKGISVYMYLLVSFVTNTSFYADWAR